MNNIIKSLLPKKSLEFLKCLTNKDVVLRIQNYFGCLWDCKIPYDSHEICSENYLLRLFIIPEKYQKTTFKS